MRNSDMPAMPVIDEDGVLDCDKYKDFVMNQATATGLTKREVFAMHAMQGLLAANSGWRNSNPMTHDVIANEAVVLADALLAELD